MIEETLDESLIEDTTSDTYDDINDTDDETSADTGTDEDVEALKSKIKDLEDKNKQLYARTKKPVKKVAPSKSNSSLTREEAILFAKGFNDEEVDLANKLAKVADTNLLVAVEDDYFKSKHNQRLKKEQSENASLGSSNKSGKFQPQNVGEMDKDEHRKLFDDIMSKV